MVTCMCMCLCYFYYYTSQNGMLTIQSIMCSFIAPILPREYSCAHINILILLMPTIKNALYSGKTWLGKSNFKSFTILISSGIINEIKIKDMDNLVAPSKMKLIYFSTIIWYQPIPKK